ncbi:hypothetical protein Vretimale_12220 [Volvox reticuliferus]|uniref:Uncharacterized protein n=1 Tax=Volvox reticuliferus TaxID=1737510 RepID=A0A8J4GJP8_9CHLO|nr:hypothetical protein Vretimale_12220 [Volvox reticuliferus]
MAAASGSETEQEGEDGEEPAGFTTGSSGAQKIGVDVVVGINVIERRGRQAGTRGRHGRKVCCARGMRQRTGRESRRSCVLPNLKLECLVNFGFQHAKKFIRKGSPHF